jgi:hypothetical protein
VDFLFLPITCYVRVKLKTQIVVLGGLLMVREYIVHEQVLFVLCWEWMVVALVDPRRRLSDLSLQVKNLYGCLENDDSSTGIRARK